VKLRTRILLMMVGMAMVMVMSTIHFPLKAPDLAFAPQAPLTRLVCSGAGFCVAPPRFFPAIPLLTSSSGPFPVQTRFTLQAPRPC
jgi:hypothetical protein